jgi:hypothetical protein
MDLFDTKTGIGFSEGFAQLAQELDTTSSNPQKNKPLENLFSRHTGWPAVSVKYIGEDNKITNRFGEARKKGVGASRYLVVLAPEAIFRPILRVAEREMAQGLWDAIVLGTRDRSPADVVHVLHTTTTRVPRSLLQAFPRAKVHSVAPDEAPRMTELSTSGSVTVSDRYSVTKCAEETGISTERLSEWLKRLARKKQLVFQGPPGCGKTFIAKRIAHLLVSDTQGEVELVQFHASLTYEDFVQGIRPHVKDGQVRYSLGRGRFMKFCERASLTPNSPFVLVVDELNRANLSRVFGELLYLLEYRGEAIRLAQGRRSFCIPTNVYIVATMNTADRSIALVDHALRRRFSFVFLAPDYERLLTWLKAKGMDDGGQLVRTLQAINHRIEDRHYLLGTSYFLAAGDNLVECMQEIWEGEIEAHLDEYFIEQQGIAEEFRWAKLAASSLSWWAEAARNRNATSSALAANDAGLTASGTPNTPPTG